MRPIVIIASLLVPSSLAASEPWESNALTVEASEFQLGGAATRSAVVPDIDLSDDSVSKPRRRLALPISPDRMQSERQSTTIGPATLFFGESLLEGQDAVQMGTFLRRGQARAGVSVTYLEDDEEVSRSELFVGYSVTNNFSVGLSGILNSELEEDRTIPQLGVSAEFTTETGAYLQGGFADAEEFEPVFGVSLGFRF